VCRLRSDPGESSEQIMRNCQGIAASTVLMVLIGNTIRIPGI
jgi:hypothetical protein